MPHIEIGAQDVGDQFVNFILSALLNMVLADCHDMVQGRPLFCRVLYHPYEQRMELVTHQWLGRERLR